MGRTDTAPSREKAKDLQRAAFQRRRLLLHLREFQLWYFNVRHIFNFE
jgi:hypothetical protein